MRDDIWRNVPGYPNYQVSRDGQVRSLTRHKPLAQAENKRGYHLVNLYRDGRPKNFLVHRLVAAAFLAVIPEGWEVNHKDGNKHNNHLENLEIVTPEQNRLHAKRHGLIRRGERNPRAKLTESQVRDIRRRRAEGESVTLLARRYEVCERAVYLICRRETWRDLD
jgi:hypothetical protein